jgi:replicative DNA helicase
MKVSEKGKLPPQVIELEEAVLGALLVDSKSIEEVNGFLNTEMFYDPKHQNIFKAISSLYNSNFPIDILTVRKKLTELGLFDKSGRDMYLVELTQKVASSANIQYHARMIHEMFIKRKVIEVSTKAIKSAYDEQIDTIQLLEVLGADLSLIDDSISNNSSSMSWYDAIVSIPEHVERLTNNDGKVTGLPTGITALDNHFSGWQPQDFIVIGGDSGMGKTAFVLCSMLSAAKEGKPVGMFSMEMSVKQLGLRAVAVETSFHLNQLMRKGFEKIEYFTTLNKKIDSIKDYPIHIDDKPALTVPEMKRKARALKRKFGIELLVIDFIQMFSGDKDIRINVGEAARECKNIAKELNIPVIALSQISREVRKSRYQIPKKYHLKEASAIEEAADVIGMLYRPSYYGYDKERYLDLYDELGLICEENAVLIVAKNRNGSLGNVPLVYLEDKTKYVDGVVTNEKDYQDAF